MYSDTVSYLVQTVDIFYGKAVGAFMVWLILSTIVWYKYIEKFIISNINYTIKPKLLFSDHNILLGSLCLTIFLANMWFFEGGKYV